MRHASGEPDMMVVLWGSTDCGGAKQGKRINVDDKHPKTGHEMKVNRAGWSREAITNPPPVHGPEPILGPVRTGP